MTLVFYLHSTYYTDIDPHQADNEEALVVDRDSQGFPQFLWLTGLRKYIHPVPAIYEPIFRDMCILFPPEIRVQLSDTLTCVTQHACATCLLYMQMLYDQQQIKIVKIIIAKQS